VNGGKVQPQSIEQEWPEELDALRAAPGHHALLFENDKVRILDTNIAPGDMVPLHTHRWPSALYVISFNNFVRRDAAGNILVDSRKSGSAAHVSALWSEPLRPHTLENVGERNLHVISVELKSHA
jgi:hypothetical protein